jgi:2'-5' RNA ligase
MKNTFLCLLPCQKDSVKLYERFNEIFSIGAFPVIKLPLHVTLYYFNNPTDENNKEILRWVNKYGGKFNEIVVADTEKIKSFAKDGSDFVYYLPLKSKKIFDLNNELYRTFEHIKVDQFPFIPHLSLFYPQQDLNKKDIKTIQKSFQDIKKISFDRLAFARENNNGINYIAIQNI